MINIVIFASGSGTNAENIIRYFENHGKIQITHVLSNKKDAQVLERAKRLHVATVTFDKQDLQSGKILNFLKENADFVILAGFLLKIPLAIVEAFPKKIINIHPSLLPKYGGKGMYGMHIHQAVIDNNDSKTGITIHYANDNYDEGDIIFQKEIDVNENDTPETIVEKVHALEYEFFPKVIEELTINLL